MAEQNSAWRDAVFQLSDGYRKPAFAVMFRRPTVALGLGSFSACVLLSVGKPGITSGTPGHNSGTFPERKHRPEAALQARPNPPSSLHSFSLPLSQSILNTLSSM